MNIAPDTLELVKVVSPVGLGLFTTALATFSVIIAKGQAQTARMQSDIARAKYRLDLFERRYEVFRAVRTTLSRGTFDDLSLEDFSAFFRGTATAVFLFGPEVNAYLGQIRERMKTLRRAQRRLAHLKDGPERDRVIEEDASAFEWFANQYDASMKVFAPYLTFNEVR